MRLERKGVPGFEDQYSLDPNTLEVISNKSGKAIHIRHDSSGYPEVHLCKDGKDYYRRVHRLFAEAYIPNPDNLPCVNHKDENRTNYNLDNLEWCDHSYNQKYGTVNERRSSKISESLKGKPKPWVEQQRGIPVTAIDSSGIETTYPSGRSAARELNVSQSRIQDILQGRKKSTHGYKFRYADI